MELENIKSLLNRCKYDMYYKLSKKLSYKQAVNLCYDILNDKFMADKIFMLRIKMPWYAMRHYNVSIILFSPKFLAYAQKKVYRNYKDNDNFKVILQDKIYDKPSALCYVHN